MKKLNKKGFTLIELLAVIVILAIVAAVTMTVVVPMIAGKNKDGALASARNMINQAMGACQDTLTADIMEPSHGRFPAAYVPCNGIADGCASAATDCAVGTCTDKTFTAAQIQAMNISGDMPSTFKLTMTKCNVTAATVSFTAGEFSGITITLADGVYSTN